MYTVSKNPRNFHSGRTQHKKNGMSKWRYEFDLILLIILFSLDGEVHFIFTSKGCYAFRMLYMMTNKRNMLLTGIW